MSWEIRATETAPKGVRGERKEWETDGETDIDKERDGRKRDMREE